MRQSCGTSRIVLLRVAVVLAVVGSAGCDDGPAGPVEVGGNAVIAVAAPHASAVSDAEVARWLAAVRRTIAPFHRFDRAIAAGWDTRITGCMETLEGAQGYHYGNTELIDGVVEDLAPELLMYEPQRNGRLRLVGVEYIVPFTAWADPDPPSLHGLDFHRNETFDVWALHVWVPRHNTTGMFADWNPNVSCAFAR